MPRLCSLNIQQHEHWPAVPEFLERGDFDLICLQELYASDLPELERRLEMSAVFAPMGDAALGEQEGVAILSRSPLTATSERDYGDFGGTDPRHRFRCVLLQAETELAGQRFHLGCTHFTWSPRGEVIDLQRRSLSGLLPLLEAQPDLILCGDFNTRRGGELWAELAGRLRDNIPAQATSTIDPELHEHHVELVVDGLFTTPSYTASEVNLHQGISDHLAITASVMRAN